MPSLMVTLEDKQVSQIELTKESYVIGRSEECDIQIDNLGVSRKHAQLDRTDNGYIMKDLGAVNGVFVNGEKTDNRLLQEGDEIVIGKFVIHYSSRIRRGHESTVVSTMKMDEETIRKRMQEIEKDKKGGKG